MIWDDLVAKIKVEFEHNPDTFLRQQWVSKTMHPNMRPLANAYWHELIQSDYFLNDIFIQSLDGPTGNPYQYEHFPRISPQTIQHDYYINLLHEKVGLKIADASSIVELGGGYGNFCRIAHNMGFNGRYQIADFHEIHKIQDYYLTNTLGKHNVEFISTNDVDSAEILIATFSLSEMPMQLRAKLEVAFIKFKTLLFAFTHQFEGVDNVEYSKELAKRIGGEWFKDKHRNAWFIICQR